ncbi:MAG: hypothetical protein GZ094_21085 [Mariniphaga sp.]|nr:hypothetical protein [Mariniphaga sp.]
MKKLSFEQMENVQGGTFFGTGDYYQNSSCLDGKTVVCNDYYVFWIRVKTCWNETYASCNDYRWWW